jgi:hypothetical protein
MWVGVAVVVGGSGSERSDEYKLECSEDGKRRWDERSDEYKLVE